MEIHYQVKELGKKHPAIQRASIEVELETSSPTTEELLKAIIREQVVAYQNRQEETTLLPYLTQEAIEEGKSGGKISFGAPYNENQVSLDKAITTALQAFEDGLYAIFYDDNEISYLHEKVILQDNQVLTFIRLTFLAGSIW